MLAIIIFIFNFNGNGNVFCMMKPGEEQNKTSDVWQTIYYHIRNNKPIDLKKTGKGWGGGGGAGDASQPRRQQLMQNNHSQRNYLPRP